MRARIVDFNIARLRESELYTRLHTQYTRYYIIVYNITHYVPIVICVFKHLDPGYVSIKYTFVYIYSVWPCTSSNTYDVGMIHIQGIYKSSTLTLHFFSNNELILIF